MYSVDERDRVVELRDLPQSSPGSPCPLVLQDEGTTVVAFYVNAPELGELVRGIDSEERPEPAALVRFRGCRATMFGPPNDEAFRGHPLASRGLEPYSAAEIHGSSWIRSLERMSSVHPAHRPDTYRTLRHFVLAFHDSTFECVAESYDFVFGDRPPARSRCRPDARSAPESFRRLTSTVARGCGWGRRLSMSQLRSTASRVRRSSTATSRVCVDRFSLIQRP